MLPQSHTVTSFEHISKNEYEQSVDGAGGEQPSAGMAAVPPNQFYLRAASASARRTPPIPTSTDDA